RSARRRAAAPHTRGEDPLIRSGRTRKSPARNDGPATCSRRRAVADLQNLDFLIAGGGGERRNVAVALLQEGARNRGNPADVPALGVHFVHADDLDGAF